MTFQWSQMLWFLFLLPLMAGLCLRLLWRRKAARRDTLSVRVETPDTEERLVREQRRIMALRRRGRR